MMSQENESLFNHFFVARQPIFNNLGEIWGYELLYRDGSDKQHAEIDNSDIATLAVATCGFSQSQELCAPSKKIAINFTEKLILEGAPRGLPPAVTVVEVKADSQPRESLIDVLRALKQEQYWIAVEGYTGQHHQDAWVPIADVIKVDTSDKTESEIENIFFKLESVDCMKLASKVDRRESVGPLRALGCDLYQGYFFAKPVNLRGRTLKSTQAAKLRLLQTIEKPRIDAHTIKESIKADPGTTYRLMRFLNSAAFGFRAQIESVSHAINLIGIKQLKYWLRMTIMADLMGTDKTPELYVMALNRGRFLEELAQHGQLASADPDSMFLFGLLSLIESMLEVPLERIVSHLPLSDKIKSGYSTPSSTYGKYLQLMIALEAADTSDIKALCRETRIDRKAVAEAFRCAIAWAHQMSQVIL